jgi:hypothetical protein
VVALCSNNGARGAFTPARRKLNVIARKPLASNSPI